MEYDPDSKFKYQIVTKYVVVETESGEELEDFDSFEEALECVRDLYKENRGW